ncbi:MAG: LPS assembly lipoprotein LptE [Chlamydiota bacterium]|jgi:outer membrane lipopolysaccharide assembly protein LptE/RlpB
MRRAIKKLTIIILFLGFTSCGYQFIQTPGKSVSLSFVENDEYGLFTTTLIEKIGASGLYVYKNNNADYLLDVKLTGVSHEVIGYRKDLEKDFTKRENIIADEGRLNLIATVELIDLKNNETVLGPFNVSSSQDYDYVDENSLQDLTFINSNGIRQTVLSFSLGQLESEESARSAAFRPAFHKLAEKIVDVISIE